MVLSRVLLFAVVATVVQVALALQSIQPPANLIHPIPITPQPASRRDSFLPRRGTNAKRLAAGLPPLPPRALLQRGSRTDNLELARGAAPSSIPGKKFSGIISATSSKDGSFIGYIGKDFQIFGEYGAVQDAEDALQVSISGLKVGFNGPLNIHQTNGDTTFKTIGGISGFASTSDTLKPGSFNYLYVGGTRATPVFGEPDQVNNAFTQATGIEETSESAIWIVNTHTSELTAEWINPDGNAAKKSQIAFFPGDNVFIIAGGLNAFETMFGSAIPVTLTLVAV